MSECGARCTDDDVATPTAKLNVYQQHLFLVDFSLFWQLHLLLAVSKMKCSACIAYRKNILPHHHAILFQERVYDSEYMLACLKLRIRAQLRRQV